MTTNELLREFIEFSNNLEPERNRISKARGNIFLKNHRPEFKNLDIPLVSNNEVKLKALLEKLLEENMCSVVGDELIKEALKSL